MTIFLLAVFIILSFPNHKVKGNEICPQCKCCNNSKCSDGTQKCYGCREGYWGSSCSYGCPESCVSCSQYYGSDRTCLRCQDGYYNGESDGKLHNDCCLKCPQNCKSCSSNHCDCKSPYWGVSCENTCSVGCVSQACQQQSGKCMFGCKVGFNGESCDTCDSGFSNQSGRCSNCSIHCDSCSTEGLCLKCKDHFGGVACETACPSTCRSCTSNKICTECTDGYFDQTCSSTCHKGRWGSNCSSVCPSNCLNGDCNHSNGSCTLGCKEGYKGETCDCPSNCEECDPTGFLPDVK